MVNSFTFDAVSVFTHSVSHSRVCLYFGLYLRNIFLFAWLCSCLLTLFLFVNYFAPMDSLSLFSEQSFVCKVLHFFCNYRKCVCFEKEAWCDTQYTEYKLGRNSKKKKKNSVQFLPSILYGQNEYLLGHPVYCSYFIHPSRLFGDYFE